jgi:hypothetical protein
MKLRLHGTPADCATAARLLRRTPGLHITDQSRPYPDRTGLLVRVFLTAHLDPTASRTGVRVGSRAGRRR